MAEGAGVAENAGYGGEGYRDIEAEAHCGEFGGEQRKDGADNGGAEGLTNEARGALNAAGASRAVNGCCHDHNDIVGRLEHAETNAANGHAPGNVEFARSGTGEEQQQYADNEDCHAGGSRCARIVALNVARGQGRDNHSCQRPGGHEQAGGDGREVIAVEIQEW